MKAAPFKEVFFVKILLVDDETDLVEIMEFLVQNSFPAGTVVEKAFNGNEAIKILSADKIDVCVCDHNMPNGMGSDVLKFIIQKNLSTKFVLCSTVTPKEKPQEYPQGNVFFNIQKPDVGSGLMGLKNLLQTEQDKARSAREEFIPISLYFLELMGKTPADVYIRASENHFVKVLKANEEFTAEDKRKYSNKPLEMLFLKKGAQQETVDRQIAAALQKIMDQKIIPLSDKLSIAHAHLVELIKFTGITPEVAELSKKNILQSATFISNDPLVAEFWRDLNLIGEYPSKLYTLHSMLTSIVVRKIVWNSEATQFKLSLSAFLQDISLDSIALMEICDYQEFLAMEPRFSRAEIRRFNEHPHKSVELLSHFKDIPPDIDRILIEQHEMPGGEGFPKKLNSMQIAPLSGVFILTGILARFVLREGKSFDLKSFVSLMEEKGYSKGNFNEAFEIIKAMV